MSDPPLVVLPPTRSRNDSDHNRNSRPGQGRLNLTLPLAPIQLASQRARLQPRSIAAKRPQILELSAARIARIQVRTAKIQLVPAQPSIDVGFEVILREVSSSADDGSTSARSANACGRGNPARRATNNRLWGDGRPTDVGLCNTGRSTNSPAGRTDSVFCGDRCSTDVGFYETHDNSASSFTNSSGGRANISANGYRGSTNTTAWRG